MNTQLILSDSAIDEKTMLAADGRLKKGVAAHLRSLGKKWCPQCRRILDRADFGANLSENDGKARYCKPCYRHVQRGMSAKRAPVLKSDRGRQKEELVIALGGKCGRCGYDEFLSALDFHHVASHEKKFQIAVALVSWDKQELKEELDKCALLCSNCHRAIREWEHEVTWEKEIAGWRLVPVDNE